jgi:phosphate starvation-inducible PhoH-like protein
LKSIIDRPDRSRTSSTPAHPESVASPADDVLTLDLEPEDTRRLSNLCGQLDQNLGLIEERLGIEIRNRGHHFSLHGPKDSARAAMAMIEHLYAETASGYLLTPDDIHLHLQSANLEQIAHPTKNSGQEEISQTAPAVRTRHNSIKARGMNQQQYLQAIRRYDINFGTGPAGTGKTYLAVACAVEALMEENVERLILVRPAVEAGEKLGFLPGDLAQKIDPYLRPLYDALYEMLGFDTVHKLLERNVIEIAPLAYMRGRTLNNAFIILDESQNTTPAQMKMFLTRIGFGSTAVITGDTSQIDLPKGTGSGLLHCLEILKDVDGISITRFNSSDVVRHPLVQRIVDAYDNHSTSEKD